MGIEEPAPGPALPMENPGLTIFDIDGTLLPGTSTERLFVGYLVDHKILRLRNLFSFIKQGLVNFPRGRDHVLSANKGYLRGFETDYMIRIGKRFFSEQVAERISKKGIMRLEEHRGRGERILLLSGMPEFLLRNFSEHLGVDDFAGSVLETNDGKLTGRTIGTFPIADGKVEMVERFVIENEIEWNDVTAYGDHYGDRFLLAKAGRAVAVNPGPRMRELAEEKGWGIEIFD
jgi:HAD superfamily hydrolase (TIGR01490 family)